jgi:hypothetical protein
MSRALIATTGLALLGLTGCLDEFVNEPSIHNKVIDVPQLPEASVAVAARVDVIGRQLLGQNPFLGVEPTFHTYGREEPEITHPDLNGVLVTEGLVKQCRSDDELAAVLALELAKMAAERRAADRLKAERLPHLPDAGATGLGADPTQTGTQAMIDKTAAPRPRSKPLNDGAHTRAEDILKGAGFDPKALDTVAPLVAEAQRNHAFDAHLGPRGRTPRWSN